MKHTALRRLAAIVLLVVLAVSGFAQDRNYFTYGRNPVIPGGLTPDAAKSKGWDPFQMPQDFQTTMYGASGERIVGWIKAGTWVAWDTQNRLRVLVCGNPTDAVRVVVEKEKVVEREKIVKVKGDTEYIPVPVIKEVPGPIEYRTEYVTEYRDRYLPIMILAPQQQYIANMGGTTVVNPIVNGIPGFNFSFSRISANGYGAAAAAAAAAASTSSTAVTPTSGAGTSGSGGSGSSGAAGGGGDKSKSG